MTDAILPTIRAGFDRHGRFSGTMYRDAPWLLEHPPATPVPVPDVDRTSSSWRWVPRTPWQPANKERQR
jgi:hypothetical protein